MANTQRWHALLAICLWWVCGLGTSAAHANEPVADLDLKAAYIFNFIQFIDWPDSDGAPGNDVTVCVSAFSPLKRALTALDGKQATKGRTVRVRLLDLPAIRGCRVLIVHNAEVEPVLRLLRTLPPSHGILTVSDEITFVNPEIVIALASRKDVWCSASAPTPPTRPASSSAHGCCGWPGEAGENTSL